jgi:hypothetical protein
MQGGLAVHRVDERHVVDTPREPRQQIRHPESGSAVLAKPPVARLAVAGFRGEELDLSAGVERLSGPALQLRLVVVGVDVADAAGAEDLDDALRPRLEWRRFRVRIAQ